MHDEIEIKLNLQSEHNYASLLKRLGPSPGVVKQTNHFFDTNDRALLKRGWALRLRCQNGNCLLTLKGPRRGHIKGLAIREEYETAIDPRRTDNLLKTGLISDDCPDLIKSHLDDLGLTGPLANIVSFQNERVTLKSSAFGLDHPIELDMTRIPDGSIDYELEMELERPDEYPAAFRTLERLLGELGIPVCIMNDSKFARVLKSLNMGHLYRET